MGTLALTLGQLPKEQALLIHALLISSFTLLIHDPQLWQPLRAEL